MGINRIVGSNVMVIKESIDELIIIISISFIAVKLMCTYTVYQLKNKSNKAMLKFAIYFIRKCQNLYYDYTIAGATKKRQFTLK